jgi:hypothetical protein
LAHEAADVFLILGSDRLVPPFKSDRGYAAVKHRFEHIRHGAVDIDGNQALGNFSAVGMSRGIRLWR